MMMNNNNNNNLALFNNEKEFFKINNKFGKSDSKNQNIIN